MEAFTQEQQEDLLAGKAILADVKDADGRSSKAFVQIDTETNQVMSVPTPVIGRNLEVLKDELKLSSAELTVMQKGEPLTLIMEDEQVTVGIDLNDKTGIRINQGDSQKWKENTKREWDKYTFGCYGCWAMTVILTMCLKRNTRKNFGMSRRRMESATAPLFPCTNNLHII